MPCGPRQADLTVNMTALATDKHTGIKRCALCKIDRKGRFILANQEAQNLFGLTEVELFGRPFVNFLDAADRPVFQQLVKNRNPYETAFDSACLTLLSHTGVPIPATVIVSVNFGGGNPANYQIVMRPEDRKVTAGRSGTHGQHWEELARLLSSDDDWSDLQHVVDLLRDLTGISAIAIYDITDPEISRLVPAGAEAPGLPALEHNAAGFASDGGDRDTARLANEVRATFALAPDRLGLIRFVLPEAGADGERKNQRSRTELVAELIHAARPPIQIPGVTEAAAESSHSTPEVMDRLGTGMIILNGPGEVIEYNQAAGSILSPASEPIGSLQEVIELIGARCGDGATSSIEGYLAASSSHDSPPGFDASFPTLDGSTLRVKIIPLEANSEKRCCLLFCEGDTRPVDMTTPRGLSLQVVGGAVTMLRSSVEAAASVWQKLEHEHHNDLKRDGGFYLTCLSHHLDAMTVSLGDLEQMVRLIGDDEELQIVDLQLLIERLAAELTAAHPELSFAVRHTDLPKIKLSLRKITAVLHDVLAIGVQAEGDCEVEVTVAASVENGNCVIWVRDNGPGLTRKQQKRIFRLRRSCVPGETGRAPDLSAGLLPAREIVASMNGFLELESDPGKGTIIKIVVPLS